MVRVQPEEPIFSRACRDPLAQSKLTVGDFVGGLLRFRWPSHARQVPAQRRTATRDVTARCPVSQPLLVRLKSADRVFPLLAVLLSPQSARIASPCKSWSVEEVYDRSPWAPRRQRKSTVNCPISTRKPDTPKQRKRDGSPRANESLRSNTGAFTVLRRCYREAQTVRRRRRGSGRFRLATWGLLVPISDALH